MFLFFCLVVFFGLWFCGLVLYISLIVLDVDFVSILLSVGYFFGMMVFG